MYIYIYIHTLIRIHIHIIHTCISCSRSCPFSLARLLSVPFSQFTTVSVLAKFYTTVRLFFRVCISTHLVIHLTTHQSLIYPPIIFHAPTYLCTFPQIHAHTHADTLHMHVSRYRPLTYIFARYFTNPCTNSCTNSCTN